MNKVLSILTFFFLIGNIYGQDSTTVNSKKLRNYTLLGTGIYIGGLIGLNALWYSDSEQRNFHFFNDNSQWKQVDKVGHTYSAYQLSRISKDVLKSTGLDDKNSAIYGSISGFLLLSPIEILDGFASDYGASYGDLIANFIGSGAFLTNELLNDKIYIMPKFSFHKSKYASRNPDLLGNGIHEEMIKDYNGQSYWLSFNASPRHRVFKWINLSLGYGAEEMVFARDRLNQAIGLNPNRQYYFGFEFNTAAIKTDKKGVKLILYMLEMIKIPGPTLILQNNKLLFRPLYY